MFGRLTHRAAFLVGVWGTSSCGGHTAVSTTSENHDDAGEVPQGADASALPGMTDAGGCMPGLATASELASTPRANVNLELLALKLSSGRIVADDAIYQRVVRDVGAIRAINAELAAIQFFAWSDGRSIDLTVPVDTSEQMKRGDYHAWDCLNATYGAGMPFEYIRIGADSEVFVSFKVKGIYAVDLLAAEYARLPSIMHAEGGGGGGDGPTICVTPGDNTWHYVFDAAGGDCPAGCTTHAYSHFTTDGAGSLMVLETWSGESGMPAPAWVGQYVSRAVCH